MWKIILKYPGTFQYTFCRAHYETPKNWRNFIISNCPGGCQGKKIHNATQGDNMVLWASVMTDPDSWAGWPQICSGYVILLKPKWGAPWGSSNNESFIAGPIFRTLNASWAHWQPIQHLLRVGVMAPRRTYCLHLKQGKSEGFASCNWPSNFTRSGWKSSIFQPVWPWNLMDGLEKHKGTSSILHQALGIISNQSVNQNWSYSPETPNLGQNLQFLSPVTLKFDGWPWKTIGHLFYSMLSFVHHFKSIDEFKLEWQSGNLQFGSQSVIFCPLWAWNLMDDLEKNRAPLQYHVELCV